MNLSLMRNKGVNIISAYIESEKGSKLPIP
jgi:hypothetical protein